MTNGPSGDLQTSAAQTPPVSHTLRGKATLSLGLAVLLLLGPSLRAGRWKSCCSSLWEAFTCQEGSR